MRGVEFADFEIALPRAEVPTHVQVTTGNINLPLAVIVEIVGNGGDSGAGIGGGRAFCCEVVELGIRRHVARNPKADCVYMGLAFVIGGPVVKGKLGLPVAPLHKVAALAQNFSARAD